jgi:hypothetical protein
LNIASNWGGLLMSYSLSEVQFAAIPAAARTPEPASGSTGGLPNATVTWRAGREAAEHTIYMGTDVNAVADGSASSVTSNTNSLDLTPLDLQMSETYYWRVDEVNQAEATPVWPGPVWNFSTAEVLIVDDFESYGNASPNRPFQTWLDGFGYSADEYFSVGYPGNGTGAGIGHDIWSLSSPDYGGDIMETDSAINGSGQSMPFYYSNSGGVASQTERPFASPQDWTVGAAQTLSIPFSGQDGNTGTLYVMINDVKVTYPHDPANISLAAWQAWNIDLASVNTNLHSVTKLVIGVDGSSASGMMLIDDITLHAEAGELITPVQPADTDLILHFTFDEGAGSAIGDSSGNGNNGTFESIPVWVTGVSGSAASFDGVGSYVSTGKGLLNDLGEFTIACWLKGDFSTASRSGLVGQNDCIEYAMVSANQIEIWTPQGGSVQAAWPYDATSDWHQITAVGDGTSLTVYIDGRAAATGGNALTDGIYGNAAFTVNLGGGGVSDATGNWLTGEMDDVRIYTRALSAEEVLWIAGTTTPIDKPF